MLRLHRTLLFCFIFLSNENGPEFRSLGLCRGFEVERIPNEAPFDRSVQRRLTQERPNPDGTCRLPEGTRDRSYDAGRNVWTVDEAIVGEVDGDWQSLVDCAVATGATLRFARRLRLEVSETIRIRDTVTIRGEGENEDDFPRFVCPSNSTLFSIRGAQGVVLQRLRFSDCAPSNGGSPVQIVRANVTIRRCYFDYNRATNGGAISVLERSSLVLDDSTFFNNTATAQGGALFLDGAVDVQATSCTFRNNSAETGGAFAAVLTEGAQDERTTVTVSESTVRGNRALGNGGAFSFLPGTRGRVSTTRFVGNHAKSGGALYLYNDTHVTTSVAEFVENRADTDGGAVFVEAQFPQTYLLINAEFSMTFFEMEDSSCLRNQATYGGCISLTYYTHLALRRSTIRGNAATSLGGAVSAYRIDTAEIDDVVFENNTARHAGALGFDSGVVDEPLQEGVVVESMNRANVNMTGCTFRQNSVRMNGGAIQATGVVSLWMERCLFEENSAENAGGAVHLLAVDYDEDDSFNTVLQRATGRGDAGMSLLAASEVEFEAVGASTATGLLPVVTVNMTDVEFRNNHAVGNGAGIAALSGCVVRLNRATLVGNSAKSVGGVYLFQSIGFFRDCRFDSNVAQESAGALSVQGVKATRALLRAWAQGYVMDAVFTNNSAGNYGGAIVVDGLSASLKLVKNVTLEHNRARGGGAISYEIASLLNVTNAVFHNNSASQGGGALAMMFIQFRDNYAYFNDVVFKDNSAENGGVVEAVFHVHVADRNIPRLKFDGADLRPSFEMNNSRMENNEARRDGGALFFDGIPAAMLNVTVLSNRANGTGGAMRFVGASVVKIVSGAFRSNEANEAGAVRIDARNMMHCIRCRWEQNSAESLGGAVAVVTEFYEPQPIAFQCDDCDLRNNTAKLGGRASIDADSQCDACLGALHVGYVPQDDDGVPQEDGYVVLRGVEFRGNVAETGGGAVMAAHPAFLSFACRHVVGENDTRLYELSSGYVSVREARGLLSFSNSNGCSSWRGSGGKKIRYGRLRGSYAERAAAEFATANVVNAEKHRIVFNRTASTPLLPPIDVRLFDDFGQWPAQARPHPPSQEVRLRAEGIELSGQLSAHIVDGEATLNAVSVRGRPGLYDLVLEFSDPLFEKNTLGVEILHCPIGWSSVSNGMDCEKCERGTYNFRPQNGTCRTCPGHSQCRSWGIEPDEGYWVPFPCYEHAKECLTRGACGFGGREDKFAAFFEGVAEPTCNLTLAQLETFRGGECAEGYTGPLCGSCVEGYGRFGFECRRCSRRALVVFAFLCALCWFLCVVVFAVKNNLQGAERTASKAAVIMRASRSLQPQPERMPSLASRSVFSLDLEAPNSRLTLGSPGCSSAHVPTPPSPAKFPPATLESTKSIDYPKLIEEVKTRIAETFKIFINFAQVNGIALGMNVSWSRSISAAMRSLDFVGIISADGAVALDCLFSSSSSTPRTISREILSFAFPFISLAICIARVGLMRKVNGEIRRRRAILCAVVIFYVSYIGITRRLVRMFYCEDIADGSSSDDIEERRYWTEDTGVECYTGAHLAVVLCLVVPLFCCISVAFPVYSGVALTRSRVNGTLNSEEMKEKFGFMFRGYSEKFVFWDSVIMARKALLAVVVGLGYPMGPSLQGVLSTFVLLISVYLQTRFCPFREDMRHLNHTETASLSVSTFTFLSGFALNDSRTRQIGRILVSTAVVGFLAGFAFYCFGFIYFQSIHFFRLDLEANGQTVREAETHSAVVKRWLLFRTSHRFHAFVNRRPPR